MAFTVKIISTPTPSVGDTTQEAAHELAVKTYLDGATINTLHSTTTMLQNGYFITVIVFE